MSKIIVSVNPILDYSVRELCKKPYYSHPNGCPNFNKKQGCPPQVKYFDQIFDITKPIYAICNVFSFLEHVKRMRRLHPEWSDHQLKCCLYWQGTARKQLRSHVAEFTKEHNGHFVTYCPEGMGVNVTETLKNVGIFLEWPPVYVSYQVALAGIMVQKGGKCDGKNVKTG
ncbi:hypothetical protein [Candidatus Formimonas warabiya]|uniref:DUF2284 domain-containing protein n=1 Tax=Formimonas warabiya TaxID=1761012 RepID=A0A3G1KNU6_FORW1|nr:hypothetical protein [Candidatus Formimonas warabiya]ATW24143.1 hypothetical protein DCMF_04520 [Candidatus Formimonas warabiya]